MNTSTTLHRTHLLAALALAAPAAFAGDRIFADGFDPCCQIGGTVSGLTGSGLVLHLTADGGIAEVRPITGNGLYRFAASVPPGARYSLGFASQPTDQTCQFAITGGTMGTADINNADVACGGNLIWDQGDWGEPWH